jgi:hypothetical protein
MTLSFGIVGNCQARGMARSLDVLVPGSTTIVFHLAKVLTEPSTARLQVWADALAKCDAVFTLLQEDPSRTRGPLETSVLEAFCGVVVKYPYIASASFHPDCTYIRCAGTEIRGPMGPYHSSLVAACHTLGVPKSRVEKLLNAFYFASSGYLTDANLSLAGFVTANKGFGFDFGPFIERTAGSPFMHTVNHPTADIIHEMTIQALDKAGITIPARSALPPADELADGVIWPVYPEIARRMNVAGSFTFQAHPTKRLNLVEYIAHAYQAYDQAGGELNSPQVERCRQVLEGTVLL